MKIPKFIKSYATICPHGVIGGLEGGRCKVCSRKAAEKASIDAGHAKCPHGVWGGKEARRCKMCATLLDMQARRAAEIAALSTEQRAELDRKNEIFKLAASTQAQELARLKIQYIPLMNDIYDMSAFQFEDFMAHIFTKLGYSVTKTPKTNDQGRDAIMKIGGKKYLLECKRYALENSSGRPDIQKFHSAIISDNAVGGFFVTTGKFTDNAVNYAANKSITLIDRTSLKGLIADAYKDGGANGDYTCICTICGAKVTANVDRDLVLACGNGHQVRPTIQRHDIIRSAIRDTNVKSCPKCSSPMRRIKGPYGWFYGCVKYPNCDGKLK